MHDDAYVSIDGESVYFPCHDDGSRWNGYVRPLFTLDALHDVARWVAEDSDSQEVISIEGTDAFLVHSEYDDDREDYADIYTRIPQVGSRYRLDGWVWTS